MQVATTVILLWEKYVLCTVMLPLMLTTLLGNALLNVQLVSIKIHILLEEIPTIFVKTFVQ